ncbi:UDP-glycosyltransferase 83A1 [Musa acuminata AAA Group]|uniref:UDP-glycosyltransferase 83A1 n=1 Tax=Musa acuminata AAA Group TaxID=214697 RepID=UPI0031D71D32
MSPPPQVLVLPFPAQGHVVSFMSLSRGLVEQGFRITFVNTEFNHGRIAAAMSDKGCDAAGQGGIRMVAIPDGLAPGDDRNDLGKLVDGYLRVMPGCLEELITSINESGGGEGDGIGWMIADENMAWALEVAKKMGIRAACYWTASAAMLATMMSIPKMIREGILGADGLPRRHGKYQLSPGMPSVSTTQFAWNCAGDAQGQKIIFQLVVNSNRLLELAEFIICNTVHEMESPVFALFPNILPVGPLISRQRLDHKPMGHFWPEDTTCVKWLDEQPANSVIYVAFGSFTVFDYRQLQELALGLELSRRPFLWVVRPDLASEASVAWLDSFRERTAGRGKMVSWSPQQQILAHPSIACFLSHCGWNSTMEGVWNGVPFLCWPYFTDQFLDQVYICDVWKIGLSLNADDEGTEISREQIRVKLEELLGDEGIKARAMMWKDIARKSVGEGGSSYKNMKRIVEEMNGQRV